MKNFFKLSILLFIVFLNTTIFAVGRISNAIDPMEYFVKHSDYLQNISSNLAKSKKASIVGTSGMGKTQFARTYAKENLAKYEIVWFLDCNLNQGEEFLELAKAINKHAGKEVIAENAKLAKKEVMNYLATKNKWLLVFDNIKSGENAKLQDIMGWEHNGDVIFASQSTELLPNTIKLNALAEKDGIALARKILSDKNDEAADFIAKEFNGYPIMIVQGAQLMNKVPGLSQEEYKNRLFGIEDKVKFNVMMATSKLSSTAKSLLDRISFINNQAFSKNFLKYITDHKDTLEEDIAELSEFMLISNIDNNTKDPIFAVHDVVTLKLQELMEDNEKTFVLERITDNLGKNIPKGSQDSYVFMNSHIVNDNIEIMLKNIKEYPINIHKEMELKLHMYAFYDGSGGKEYSDWFIKKKQQKSFDPTKMTEHEIYIYCKFTNWIAGSYVMNYNLDDSIKYSKEARHLSGMISDLEKHTEIKLHALYQLSRANTLKANLDEAKENINSINKLFADKIAKPSDIGYLYLANARYYYMKGEYKKAIEYTDKDIAESKKHGLDEASSLFSSTYIIRFNALHKLKRHKEAKKYADLLKKMHIEFSKNKVENAIAYSKLAEQYLTEKHKTKAKDAIIKSINSFKEYSKLNDNFDLNNNMYYSRANVIYGNFLLTENKKEEALKHYKIALEIPKKVYGKNIDKMHFVKLLKAKIAKLQK